MSILKQEIEQPRIKLFGFSKTTSLSIADAILYLVIRAFIMYQAYFWWRGLDVLPQPPCEEVVWVFIRARLRGVLKHFLRVLFLIWAIGVVFDMLCFLWVARKIGKSVLQTIYPRPPTNSINFEHCPRARPPLLTEYVLTLPFQVVRKSRQSARDVHTIGGSNRLARPPLS